jgi:hypothetical protein
MPLTQDEELELLELEFAASQAGKTLPVNPQTQGDVTDNFIPREARAAAYGLSGGQIPFGNVITSGIGAGIAKIASPLTGDPRSFGELYNQAQADTKAVQEESPTASMLGNLAGVATTLPAAFSKPVQGAGMLATPAKGLQNVGSEIAKVASATPFKGTGMLAEAGNLGSRMLGGAVVSAPIGGLYSAGEADAGQRGDAFLEGAMLSGGIGAALPVAGTALSKAGKALTPSIDDATRNLAQAAKKKYGIDLNLNQISGSNASQNIQRASQAVPLSGTEKNRLKQLSQWNKAVSGTFGQSIDDFTMDAIDSAFVKAGKPFNEILSGKTVTVKSDDITDIAMIIEEASKNVEPSKVAIVQKNIDELLSGIENGQITGEKLNSIRSSLTERAKKADTFARPYISQLVDKVVDISADGNPEIAKKLTEARRNYKNLNVALNAWDSTTNSINPVKLETAVKSLSGYGTRSYARGKAGDLGELAQIGKTFLPQVGGSPTLPAAVTGASLVGLGSGFIEPTTAALTAGGMLGNRLLQEGINRNPAVVRSMLATPQTLPALQNPNLKVPITSGMLGGYLGSK